MKLIIDIGNSSLKWAFLKERKLSSQHRVFHRAGKLNAEIKRLWHAPIIPTEIWVANVTGDENMMILAQWTKELWGLKPQEVKTTLQQAGVRNGYKVPQQLGVDRWLALIAAHQLEIGTKCVVDCGTAITLDVLSVEGQHLGGLILPGPVLMQKVLIEQTSALGALIHETQGESIALLAQETRSGVILGTMYAVASWIETMIKKISSIETLIITGGGTPPLLPFIQIPYRYIPDLVLQGLVAVAHENL